MHIRHSALVTGCGQANLTRRALFCVSVASNWVFEGLSAPSLANASVHRDSCGSVRVPLSAFASAPDATPLRLTVEQQACGGRRRAVVSRRPDHGLSGDFDRCPRPISGPPSTLPPSMDERNATAGRLVRTLRNWIQSRPQCAAQASSV